MKLFFCLVSTFFVGIAYAHHGSNGQFNRDIKIEVSGVITDVKLVNPHSYVYFNVTDENGETQEWRCEMQAVRELRKNGWTEEMFATGTEVTVAGSQARREEFGCYMDTISFAGGEPIARHGVISLIEDEPIPEVELAEGTPVFNGRWKSLVPHGGAGRNFVKPEAVVAAEKAAWPADVTVRTGRASYAQSEAGKEASAGYTSDMNPRFQCQATNLFHDLTFAAAVNAIDQSDDKIVITYGFMDIVRSIYLDMDSHPDNIVPSRAGHSIGKWEGDTLIVDTVGFSEGYLGGRAGAKHSEQMHIVERLNLAGDGEWLITTYTINDPLYLTESFTGQITQVRTGEPYAPYDCLELTEERVEGF
ncbi:MAG: hypothetical protein KTR16_09880 [Acidiferrobacterales bacterium]|nr:hypothetical protein [Acidiferrobacterales bacterium]